MVWIGYCLQSLQRNFNLGLHIRLHTGIVNDSNFKLQLCKNEDEMTCRRQSCTFSRIADMQLLAFRWVEWMELAEQVWQSWWPALLVHLCCSFCSLEECRDSQPRLVVHEDTSVQSCSDRLMFLLCSGEIGTCFYSLSSFWAAWSWLDVCCLGRSWSWDWHMCARRVVLWAWSSVAT